MGHPPILEEQEKGNNKNNRRSFTAFRMTNALGVTGDRLLWCEHGAGAGWETRATAG
jgi:hypothetical protein